MRYEYPKSRYNLLCDIFNISKDQKIIELKNDKINIKKKVGNNKNLSMDKIKEIPQDVPHLQAALKKAYNEVAYLKNSKKEMRLDFEIRLSLYHKKFSQNKKNSVNECQVIKMNLMNLLMDLSEVYLKEKVSKRCLNDACDWNKNIQFILQKYQHVPDLYENSAVELQKYFGAIKLINSNDSLMISKDVNSNDSLMKSKENIKDTIHKEVKNEIQTDLNEDKISFSQLNDSRNKKKIQLKKIMFVK